jgi:hypothetical protein
LLKKLQEQCLLDIRGYVAFDFHATPNNLQKCGLVWRHDVYNIDTIYRTLAAAFKHCRRGYIQGITEPFKAQWLLYTPLALTH